MFANRQILARDHRVPFRSTKKTQQCPSDGRLVAPAMKPRQASGDPSRPHNKAILKHREETMIKTKVFALFGLALASAAQARPFSPADQLDGMITQARMGCVAGMVMVNGACVARTTMRHARRCARWNGGVCAHYY